MPYQTQPLFQDAINTGTLTALNSDVIIELHNSSGAIVNITGTWTGTILIEGTNDNFTTAQNAAVFTPPAGVITAGITTNGYYRLVAVSGFTHVRARMSAYTSGTATIVLSASIGAGLAPTVSVNYDSMLGTSKLTGNTDNTKIGNVGDRLKTDTNITSIVGGLSLSTSKKLRYDDMNVGNGGIARATVIILGAAQTTVYNRTGSGVFIGFIINLESASTATQNWQINLIIDGEEIFNTTGINTSDLVDNTIYNFNTGGTREPSSLGMEMVDSTVYFTTSNIFPISYSSSVVIKIKKTTGANKKFQAGLVLLTKET